MPAQQNTTVRRAIAGDGAAITTLVERYWQFEAIRGFERARIEAALAALLHNAELGACWVAQKENTLCGYLIAVCLLSLEHGGMVAEIDEFFVRPQYRSQGIGAQLLEFAQSELAARGVVRLQLQLGADNHPGRRFYARHGFMRSEYELLDKPLSFLAPEKKE